MEKQHYKMYKDGKKWVFAAGTVIALGVGLSESTYVVKADSTVPVTSTNDSVNTGSASKNHTVPVTSTDDSVNTGAATSKTTSKTTVSKDNPTVFYFPFNGEDNRMHPSDGYSNGNMFNSTWRASQVNFKDGKMQLSINKDEENTKIPYISGEYRSNQNYHYGLYEVSMKPIKNDGVVSSFFTYTGPSEHNPWDEIDIEFLGKDTTGVQFNYFTNGLGHHEYFYKLGFDASEAFHTYAFEWLPDSITWFVDGKKVHTATENIPQTPGKIMMNVWPGIGVDSWLKPFDGTVPLKAEYDWVKFTQYKIVEENVTPKPEEPTTEPTESSTKPAEEATLKLIPTHNAYIYNKDYQITYKDNKRVVLKKGTQIIALDNGKKYLIKGKEFYRIGDNQYVKVSNTISYYYLVHNSFLYNKHGKTIKRNGKRILVRKGVRLEANKVKVVKINGKKFYKVGKSTYIKFRNVKLSISPNN
ncbi:glycosyl hydrolase family protein [Lactobacillus amylovorus subsp. animalium]|uniref:beta-glucanase n=1 Tax=Lactobacillus amylovorus TaxID=1604 RepID=UPI0010AC312B|nr:family 16 glycosylhydrolase [Lactobacillus amylovorus]TJY01304.1 glycosyl hydrolase family protein [Lactobacillus amylovorus]